MPAALPRPGVDAFRHVAESYGDDNPLWWDADYGATTRWGAPIAPPAMVGGDTLIGEDEVAEVDAEHRDLMKGDPLRGVHAFYAASAREWWAPLRPGHAHLAAQCARRRARQALGVRGASSARVDRAGVPSRRRPAAVGPVPQHGPHRTHEGARAQERGRARAVALRRGRDRGDRRAVRARGAARRRPSGGGTTSRTATRSARS